MMLIANESKRAAGSAALVAVVGLLALSAALGLVGARPHATASPAAPLQEITDPQTGAVFTVQNSTTALTLRAVMFVDETHGWSVGGEGERDEKPVVLRTEDGGNTWLQVGGVPDLLRLEDVWFIDRDTGWMVGVRGQIFRSDDGGRTWARQESGVGAKLTTVQFADASTGWAAEAATPALLKTTDGGASWRRIVIPDVDDESGLSNLQFLDAERGWAIGADGVLVATTDGGESWTDIGYGVNNRMYGLFFLDDQTGWVAGSLIRMTADGGQTWSAQTKPPKSIEEIVFTNRDVGYAVGDQGTFFFTRDGGQNWLLEVERFTRAALRDADIVGGRHLWAVGTLGTIIHRFDPNFATPTPLSTATPTPTVTPTPTPTLFPTPVGPWLRAGDPRHPIHLPRDGRRLVQVYFGNMPTDAVTLTLTTEGAAVLGDGTRTSALDVSAASGSGDPTFIVQPAEGAAVGDAFTLRIELGGVAIQLPGIVAHAVMFPTSFR